ncbi:MAG: hypothetical protein RBS80_27820 [Thermoguttaceae bacterium]|jgi:hypothetical protein|nr:hypothetical protein [Thermoguttaceae bacterium]
MNDDKPGPLLTAIIVIVALIAMGWLFFHLVAVCIVLLGIGLGTSPGFAVVGGFFLAIAVAVFFLVRSVM